METDDSTLVDCAYWQDPHQNFILLQKNDAYAELEDSDQNSIEVHDNNAYGVDLGDSGHRSYENINF